MRPFRTSDLMLLRWQPLQTCKIVEWCGHGQEFIPVPDDDGWCRLIPVLGEVS